MQAFTMFVQLGIVYCQVMCFVLAGDLVKPPFCYNCHKLDGFRSKPQVPTLEIQMNCVYGSTTCRVLSKHACQEPVEADLYVCKVCDHYVFYGREKCPKQHHQPVPHFFNCSETTWPPPFIRNTR
ncbi:hypothetical protein PGT21_014544 [Puccinia graminis f. sp. tritici]|uniref:Secreted protein n=1 Tax=Puccinia graminis f. sp. tritici TaxID=56615 RepID=A0A5B0QFB6_PUCGR|nr:hypothetical protein PGT21_014544 [Puccinia graminis f. sp. tritici]